MGAGRWFSLGDSDRAFSWPFALDSSVGTQVLDRATTKAGQGHRIPGMAFW